MFKDLLINHREAILENWFNLILNGYQEYAVKFLARTNNKDKFQNPVGHAIKKGITEVFDYLLQNDELKDLELQSWPKSLDQLIKIRAVQDFSPSKALEFVYYLKNSINEVLGKAIKENQLNDSFIHFETKIDSFALAAFDLYMQAREKLFQIKIMEIKNNYYAPHVYGGTLKCDNSLLPELDN